MKTIEKFDKLNFTGTIAKKAILFCDLNGIDPIVSLFEIISEENVPKLVPFYRTRSSKESHLGINEKLVYSLQLEITDPQLKDIYILDSLSEKLFIANVREFTNIKVQKSESTTERKKLRLLTGDRPTAFSFTLGAYIGTIKNRVLLQSNFDSLVFTADYHALTTHLSDSKEIYKNSLNLIRTQIALGLNPEKVTFYRQSKIPQIFRLHTILSMLTQVVELERQPMLKEKLQKGYSLTYGLLGYPVLMASDILIASADIVPVGKDNLAHIELTKSLARDLNKALKSKKGLLKVPEGLIGDVLIGLDGKGKSGKSTGGLFFDDSSESIKSKIMSMYTDPNRIHSTDPGTVENNPVFIYHNYFNSDIEEVHDLEDRYRNGQVGDIEVKEKLYLAVEKFLTPYREKYRDLESKGDSYILDILTTGEKRMNQIADVNIKLIEEALAF